jgi:hypothetical protein
LATDSSIFSSINSGWAFGQSKKCMDYSK